MIAGNSKATNNARVYNDLHALVMDKSAQVYTDALHLKNQMNGRMGTEVRDFAMDSLIQEFMNAVDEVRASLERMTKYTSQMDDVYTGISMREDKE